MNPDLDSVSFQEEVLACLRDIAACLRDIAAAIKAKNTIHALWSYEMIAGYWQIDVATTKSFIMEATDFPNAITLTDDKENVTLRWISTEVMDWTERLPRGCYGPQRRRP